MKKFFTILGFEYLTCIRNKAFIIITAFLVCASLLFAFLPEVITSLTSEDEQQIDDKPPAIALKKSVYDDELLKSSFSAAFPGYEIVISDDERKEIESKVDDGTYTFAVDITAPNAFTYITKNQTLYNSDQQYITEIIKHMFEKTELEKQGVSPEKTDEILGMSYFSELVTTGADITKNYFPVYIIMIVLFMAIATYGNMVQQSVVSEKNTRAMELLITCAKPSELMFGKVFGSGLAGLTQLGLIFLSLGCSMQYAPADAIPEELKEYISFPPETLALALVFFILGYFIYAFLLGALASFASKTEDLSGLTTPVIFLLTGIYMAVVFLCSGDMIDSTAMTVLSYIPLSAPMAMFVRAILIDVPVWELIVSIALQIVTVILFGALASAIYKIGVLMYGNPPKPAQIIKMLGKK